jgi:prepilin-type N-terminal cleavage/methylation domain-containing protein
LEGDIVKNMKRNVQQGFTLIELMIVIAIVAILVALAVPAYQDYAIRAKVGECIGQGASAKLAVEEFYQSEGNTLPADAGAAGIDNYQPTKFCASMAWSGTVMTLTTQNTGAATDPAVTLTPTVTNNKIVEWDRW